MSSRTHAEDEPNPVHALRAAAERDEQLAPTAALDAAAREPQRGRGGIPAVARAIGGLHATAGNGAVAWLLGGRPGRGRHEGTAVGRAGHAALVGGPVVQRGPDDDDPTNEVTDPKPVTDPEATTDPNATTEPNATSAVGSTGGAGATGAGDPGTGGNGAIPLGGGAPTPGPSWTKVGPPSNTSYSVSGSLRTAANAVAARKEAGSVTPKMTTDTEEFAPDGGTSKVIAARVTVDQVMELPDWSDKSSATANQQAEWNRFFAAITKHENGHVAIDKTSFAGTHSKMVGQTPSGANTNADAVEAQAKTDNDTYDTGNHHGIDQGTGINPNIDEVTKVP